ncbi:gliding motility-associated C-terminal domain-containing protein [Larkinella rosea]|uniref:Gliding motility-associated C-terminal domain-containing protein n=1 Tax=Larkinella rosea TaxID=2025312 RepID=A0A3P1BSP7_9BACT|nr:gliding motility-associated C-terminal domain-containing protein [Larkinella rosea]RRB03929.1 gliding motility-associated C-terminal domain-containing protein [Larkinella rosea]
MDVLLGRFTSGVPVFRGLWVAGCSFLLALLTLPDGFGKHIYGGEMSVRVTNRANYYNLKLTLFFDQATSNADTYERTIQLYIFRKSDNALTDEITVNQTTSQQVRYDNQACANLRNLKVLAMYYSKDIYLNPAVYNDPGGYYIVWDRCCRSADISNIQNPAGEGMLFYMEFPPVVRNGAAFINSSPEFSFPNGEYICVNKPFKLNFNATDTDGDQLRYSLVTPLAGFTDNTPQNTAGDGKSHASYPEVIWLPGYSAARSIPGNPPLSINAQTGQLSMTATQTGLFIFAVLCEEYRNGVKIGAVRREFQMPVVDCGNNTPPAPVISYKNIETLDLPFCDGTTVLLSTESNPLWSYQWQRNGSNIPGATSATLTINETGDYAVVKSFAKTCGNDTTSKVTKARMLPPPAANIATDKAPPLCEGQSLRLSVQPETAVSYQWTTGGTVLPGATNTSLTVTKTGLYGVRATSSMGCTNRDSLAVIVNPNPKATLVSSSSAICQDGEVRLDAAIGSNYQYEWLQDNASVNTSYASTKMIGQAGTYQVRITDGNRCQALSAPLTLAVIPRPVLQFDSLPPVCATRSDLLLLVANPAGGTFSGSGVSGTQFDPTKAGAGTHAITYTYAGTSACPATITRQIRVEPPAEVNLPERVTVLMGNSVQLKPVIKGPTTGFLWEPPDYLSDPAILNPLANPTTPTTYLLTVLAPGDCRTEKTVLVDVLKRMFVADVFSPNNDGVNDVLEIRNTDQFPDCEVTIYNRWGEVVFYSKGYDKPWNGTYKNQKVQPGNYEYRIKTNQPLIPEYRGVVLVTY